MQEIKVRVGASLLVNEDNCSTYPANLYEDKGKPIPFKRRRMALVAVGALVIGIYLFNVTPLLPGGARAAGASPRIQNVVTVEPGDSLWSIVVSHLPNQDPRPIVDEIVAERHTSTVIAGQRIILPANS